MASTRPAGDVRTGDERLTRAILYWCFERLYHELSWSYDAISWLVSGGRWRRWQRVAVGYLVGRRVLDVGCGPGRFLTDLLDLGFEAYGLDRSPSMQRRAQRLLGGLGRPGRVIGGDARRLPFDTASFDCLVLTFPAPFATAPEFWDDAARVLRADGRVVIVEGATSHTLLWPGLLERIWRLRRRQPTPAASPYPADLSRRTASRWSRVWQEAVRTRDGIVWLVVAQRTGQENNALTDSSE